jgi:hypothetical protein
MSGSSPLFLKITVTVKTINRKKNGNGKKTKKFTGKIFILFFPTGKIFIFFLPRRENFYKVL